MFLRVFQPPSSRPEAVLWASSFRRVCIAEGMASHCNFMIVRCDRSGWYSLVALTWGVQIGETVPLDLRIRRMRLPGSAQEKVSFHRRSVTHNVRLGSWQT